MHLSPVLLVAPEPETPKPPTVSRRMFFFGVLGSLGLGTTLGFAAGARPLPPIDPRAADDALAWALGIQDGGLAHLVRRRSEFLIVFADRRDPRLVRGLERLALAVLEEDPAVADCRVELARSLADEIESSGAATALSDLAPRLRRVR